MRSIIQQLLALGPELAAYILTAPILNVPAAHAQVFAQTAVSSPNLDLSQLGRVAVGGDFDSISLYTYQGQNENTSTNGSQSLLTRYPDGAFQSLALADADATIAAMCAFVGTDGKLNGVIVGGNFTSLGGVRADAIALWNPENNQVTALNGLTGGPVNAVYCDNDSGTVYVGGKFMAGNSTNAMAWTTGWVNLPFAGFNGPVNTITKNSDNNIVFGGSFTGLGNTTTPTVADEQAINIGAGTITAAGSTGTAGFSSPNNIICKTGEQQGSGNTWLLNDNTGGYWESSLGFGINPTMLRLYNTDYEGRGTKSFYFEEMNGGGVLNLTYVDPATGENATCVRFCPLPQGNTTAQDFRFERRVGMSVFRVWITDWYGSGAGLNGIEMYSDEVYSYAINSFNAPSCVDTAAASESTSTPADAWTRSPNRGQTPSDFLTATITDEANVGSDTRVVFQPNLQQSGNYSVTLYTPGCILDGTCSTRGLVNITGSMTANADPATTSSYQTNNYDKFEQIYYGYIDAENFQPTVTVAPVSGQGVPLTVVASRIRFELISSTGGLNGLYEYNPNEAQTSTNFSSSAINRAAISLDNNAMFASVAQVNDVLYAAGRFSGDGISNVMSVGDGDATALPRGGLNGEVLDMYLNGSMLYFGGTFSNTAEDATEGLNNLAAFSTETNEWSALGGGVNGAVFSVLPLTMNITTDNQQETFAITGNFTSINEFGGNAGFDASGFAIWVPSESNWLHNIAGSNSALDGQLTAYSTVPDMMPVYGGMISSQGLDFSDVVELVGSGQPELQSLGIQLSTASAASDSSMRKRALSDDASGTNYTGVYDGFFYNEHNLNITILGGSFSTTASNNSMIENLVFINDTDKSQQTVSGVSGLTSDSIFVAMDTYETSLWAGGVVNGTVNGNAANGLVVYELSANRFAAPHPPALGGDNVIVYAIAAQPEGTDVYVGGDYSTAGSLPCGPLCYYDTEALQWQSTGSGLSGVIHTMLWSSNTKLIIAGNLTVEGTRTTMATYDAKEQTFEPFLGADTLPGPVTAISAVDNDYKELWASGAAADTEAVFLSKYKDGKWQAATGLGDTTSIRKLQIMPLTSNHEDSDLVANDQVLMILGNINIPDQGNASAVLYNGTVYEPYILTNMDDGSQGSLSAIFVQNPQNFMTSKNHGLALGIIVAIGLAIALAIMGLIILLGLLLERRRRRIEGYVPITADKSANVHRLPPEQLFSKLEGGSAAPKI
ncbi:Putative galactose oxidase/kelch, beta-propeller, kelch-type beta propeller [Septoria linicola]|uniref:Galactose oxidase/kelch, beta-propeller, kelch-type beta propeller n=1 Tax=Septoria linicola TaxID=215465 RepID=A0A9Q9AY94_9PEZI|nr:putative galactose oxidase/kelch, beta-propeller, kelch-type beta propeller [Septoria linicola]USW54102.1 Putative galactose oxidase/kelch, beta-propeller, kelch-type beta propeller [Septoria linicola]